MSFFEELKRRNVIRVAIAYGVVAWFTLQLADVILENIVAPDWLMQTIMLVLAGGFPVIMVLAWAFEVTPEGIKKEKDVDRSQSITNQTGRKLDRMIIGILVIVVGYLLVDKLLLQGQPAAPVETAQVTPVEAVTNAKEGPSVAVLPFVNMSGDKENEYFSDGLTETLLHMLAQLPDLRVAARTSSFAFKGQNKSVSEIADVLGVAHILEGSVQKSGERIRVTAQLVRADDGFHVWSQNYTRPLEDIFAIQDEIAADVATALDASLLGNTIPDLQGMNTSDLIAYDSYLKGLQQQAVFSYGSLNIAEDNFKQALARDPSFTDARLALARNYLLKNNTGVIAEEELRSLIEPLIVQVREHDPDNRLARALELQIELTNFSPDRDIEETRAMVTELRNMLPLIASETVIRLIVANLLNFLFEQERDAIEVLEAGLLLDPLAAELHRGLGNIHRDHDRFDAALVSLQRSQELRPEDPNIYSSLATLEREKNNLAAALNWNRISTEIDPQDHELAARIAQSFYALELPEEGDRWAARVNALVPGSPIARQVEVNRAWSRKEFDHALNLAQSMVTEQVEIRRGAFATALFTYTDLMMQADRSREAWEFLVSVRPDITNFEALPIDVQGVLMQWVGVMLMTGFESFDTRKETWLKLTGNLDAQGFPWRDDGGNNILDDLIMLGDTEAAIDYFLNERLSKPMALNVGRHKPFMKGFYGPLYDDPRVAVRMAELDREFEQLRGEISEMMLEPEWTQ